jgi:RimJ/RimL family protein N-acetyltransferase
MSVIVLREPHPDDISWIFEACQDSEIQRWTQVPRPYTREHALSFVTGTTDEFARWVVQVGAPSEPVGVIGIHEVEDSVASIGYWIGRQYRGRGFTTAAIGLVCKEIEQNRSESGTEVDFVRAFIARDNRASRRAVEKAGFEMVEAQLGPAVEDLVPVPTCVYMKRL